MDDLAIYVDLDGVEADYEGGIKRLGFDIDPAIKNDLNRSGSDNPLKRAMYDAIKGTDFYYFLDLMPGAITLWLGVEEFAPIILTAAPKFGGTEANYYLNPHWLGAAYHKRRWVEQTLLPEALWQKTQQFEAEVPIPDERFICCTSARKWQFMHRKHSPHQVLIDDRKDNCIAWAEAGGFAILYDGDAEKALEYLRLYRQDADHMREAMPRGGGIIAGLHTIFTFVPKIGEAA